MTFINQGGDNVSYEPRTEGRRGDRGNGFA